MVDRITLDHLIDRATNRSSAWRNAPAGVAAAARDLRVHHAAEILLQLGHEKLAGELLRLERNRERIRASAATEWPPAA